MGVEPVLLEDLIDPFDLLEDVDQDHVLRWGHHWVS